MSGREAVRATGETGAGRPAGEPAGEASPEDRGAAGATGAPAPSAGRASVPSAPAAAPAAPAWRVWLATRPEWVGETLAILAAASAFGLLLYLLARPTAPPEPESEAPLSAATAPPAEARPGYIAVEAPPGAVRERLRATVLQAGAPVLSVGGRRLEGVPAAELALEELPPGRYTVRLTYRDRPLRAEETAEVEPASGFLVEPPRAELAAIEFAAGTAEESRRAGAGRDEFQRTLRLDPTHRDARLWLALDALLRRAGPEAAEHLAAARALDPHHPALPRLQRLLRALQGGGR